MNGLENWFCATTFWSNVTCHRLLPRMLDGVEPGARVLELGAGSGAATPELLRRFRSVTSLDSAAFVTQASRAARNGGLPGTHSAEEMRGAVDGGKRAAQLVRGDAAQLPFADESFSCAIAILMLHHLRSQELQDAACAEIRRVLQPGGVFLALEINDGWLQRLVHTRSTFVPVKAHAANARLNAAGFARVSVDFMRGAFLLRAQRMAE